MQKLNREKYPTGSKVFLASTILHPHGNEARVLQWSPNGMVVELEDVANNTIYWTANLPFVVDVLPEDNYIPEELPIIIEQIPQEELEKLREELETYSRENKSLRAELTANNKYDLKLKKKLKKFIANL